MHTLRWQPDSPTPPSRLPSSSAAKHRTDDAWFGIALGLMGIIAGFALQHLFIL